METDGNAKSAPRLFVAVALDEQSLGYGTDTQAKTRRQISYMSRDSQHRYTLNRAILLADGGSFAVGPLFTVVRCPQ